MGIIIWLIIGGVVGWLASLIMKTDGQQGVLLNIVVGIVGAFLAGWFISPMVGVGTINQGIKNIFHTHTCRCFTFGNNKGDYDC